MGIIVFEIEFDTSILRDLFIKLDKNDKYLPVNFIKETPIHKETYPGNLPGEVFLYDPITHAEGSNLGRVKYNGNILEQFSVDGKADDYLFVYIPNNKQERYGNINVWRIIASAWCRKRKNANEVHHINNNGFDNRPSNLLWVSREEHQEIEKGIFSNIEEK